MGRSGSARYFATASRGTEEVLAEELRALDVEDVDARPGGVAFGRRLEDAYRACLWSRVASRVLYPLVRFDAGTAGALYQGVHAVDWTAHLGPEKTLAVDVAGSRSPAGPPHFLALKTKDAIVDRVRSAEGARPDVDTARPDVRINVHVATERVAGSPAAGSPAAVTRPARAPAAGAPATGPWARARGAGTPAAGTPAAGPPAGARSRVTVSLDFAGRGLHRRGIDRAGAAAPLKENLAAAVLWIAGWPARCASDPLFDPLCGSGTLLVEAAWMALDVAPGLARRRIGAEGWRGHDAALWQRLLAEARERRDAGRERGLRIAGADDAHAAVRAARANLERAGLGERVRIHRGDLREVEAPWDDAGVVVTNPPYGERLGEAGELGPFYELLGDVLKRRFPGWSAWVLSGNPALAKRIGLRPARRHVLHNGPIECRLLEIPISATPVAGDKGPGWRKPSAEATGFANKLRKNRRRLGAWAKRRGITCYRLYDTDLSTYNLAVDWYDGAVRVEEYERPRKVDAAVAERRLRDALQAVPEVLDVDPAEVVLRVRGRRAAGEQAQRRGDRRSFRRVAEGDLRFEVNLTDYLDTGLFLDDRLLRTRLREGARDRDVLNLFAYTCTASVAAAAGGARSVTSVDLSKVYLDWGRRNFALNGPPRDYHRFVRADVLQWLDRPGGRRDAGHRRYGLIFLAPPTWSRSKAMRGDFDVVRDHARLLGRCLPLLAPGGEILFSTHARDFVLEEERLPGLAAREITTEITPLDFQRRPRLRAWVLRRRARS